MDSIPEQRRFHMPVVEQLSSQGTTAKPNPGSSTKEVTAMRSPCAAMKTQGSQKSNSNKEVSEYCIPVLPMGGKRGTHP